MRVCSSILPNFKEATVAGLDRTYITSVEWGGRNIAVLNLAKMAGGDSGVLGVRVRKVGILETLLYIAFYVI